MATWLISQEIDLQTGTTQTRVWPNTLMEVGDKNSHEWRVAVKDGGQSVSLNSGEAVGYFVRHDGATVPVNGSVSGNVASVIMPASAFAVPGELTAIMKISLGGAILTAAVARFNVRGDITATVIDPGTAVPNLQELVTAAEACTQAAAAALEAAAEAQATDATTDRKFAQTGIKVLGWQSGYIKMNTTSIDKDAPVSSSSYVCAVCECQPGDVFYITGTVASGSVARLWAFITADETNNRITTEHNSGGTFENYRVVAPVGAVYACFNMDASSADRMVIKGITPLEPLGMLSLAQRRDSDFSYLEYGSVMPYIGEWTDAANNGYITAERVGRVIRLSGYAGNGTAIRVALSNTSVFQTGTPTAANGLLGLAQGHTYRIRQHVLSGSCTSDVSPAWCLAGNQNRISGTAWQRDAGGDAYTDITYDETSHGDSLCMMIFVARTSGNTLYSWTAEYTLEDLSTEGSLFTQFDNAKQTQYNNVNGLSDVSGMLDGNSGLKDRERDNAINSATGRWDALQGGKHIIVPVKPGDTVALKANSTWGTSYAVLRSEYSKSGANVEYSQISSPDWRSLKSLNAGAASGDLTMPSDAAFFYVQTLHLGVRDYTPVSLTLNGTDLTGNIRAEIAGLKGRLPEPPAADGSYVLNLTVTGGTPVYSWAAAGD